MALSLPAPLTPWRHKIFLSMWIATVVSSLGALIQMVGASWLMTTLTPSADMVALVQSSNSLPVLLFALVAGAFADIHDRRTVMMAAQGLMLVGSVILAAASALGWINPWLLLGLTFLIGCGGALHQPSWQASVGEQVPREDIPAAVSLNSLGFNIARAIGPAIGGLIVAAAGATAAFCINAATYVGLIAVLARWRRPRPAALLPPERIVPAIFAGVQYVRLSPPIRSVLFRALAFGLAGSGIWALAPLVARNLLHGGPTTYGLLLGGLGAGAVTGAVMSGWIRRVLHKETAVRIFVVTFGVAITVVAYSPWKPLSFVALLFAGACWLLSISTFNITVQLTSPRWVVGRALSLMQMCLFGGMAIGSWMWGGVAEAVGLSSALAISGGAMVVSALLGLHFRLVHTEKVNLEPSRAGEDLGVAVPHQMQAAPVVLSVEYKVDPENAAGFLDAMREKRRIRLRDGARQWTLLQDLGDPEIWIERYHNPSWTDYLRQRNRHTVADREIEIRVRSFHKGDEPPRVRRFVQHRPEAAPVEHHDDLHHPEPMHRQGPLH